MKISLIIIAFSTFMLVSCGGSETKPAETTPTETPVEETAKKEIVEVVIEANDQMQYDKKLIEVPAGTLVKLTLKNVGQMPIESMGHNWTLLSQGVDLVAYATASMQAVSNGYQAPDRYADPIIYTRMLGPGEMQTIEFDAPAAGTYKYLCTFPGHYGAMQGDFIVK